MREAASQTIPLGGRKSGKIGRYEIVEEIGRGSMGVVYLARDPLISRWVAVKQLTGIKGHGLDPEVARNLLLNEAKHAGALQHSGIVTVFDVIEDGDGRVGALAMEYVKGESLRDRLKSPEPISLQFVSDAMAAVADVLDYAHDQGFIHRDVKPANILLAEDGAIKVADFGIAGLRGEDLAAELKSLGTPNFLAPERILGQAGDHRVDLYSLGVILYELLTRHLPFQGETVGELVQKIIQEKPTPPELHAPHLTVGLREALAIALAKEPEDRYGTAKEMANDVRRAVDAQAALNDTVPTGGPVELEPIELESIAPEVSDEKEQGAKVVAFEPLAETTRRPDVDTEPAKVTPPSVEDPPVSDWLADEPSEGLLSEISNVLEASEPELASAVETKVPVGVAEPAIPADKTGSRSATVGVALWHRLQAHPLLAAAAAFLVLGIPLILGLLSKLDGNAAGNPSVVLDTSAADQDRLRYLSLLKESQDLYAAGEREAAARLLAQAAALVPEADRIRELGVDARWQVATEREMTRVEEIERLEETAHLAIARADFRTARMSIEELRGLSTPEESLEALDRAYSVAVARLRARQAKAEKVEEPEPELVAAEVAEPALLEVAEPEPIGPGTLRIDFRGERSRGVLTVYSGETQLMRRPFRFVQRKNFLVRKGVSGVFEEALSLEPGVSDLKVYLAQPNYPTKLETVRLDMPAAGLKTLDVRVSKAGELSLRVD